MGKKLGIIFGVLLLTSWGCEEASSSDEIQLDSPAGGEGGILFIDPDASVGTGGADQVTFEGDTVDEGFQFATDVSAGLADSSNGDDGIKVKMCEGDFIHSCEECACQECPEWAAACNQVPGCNEVITCSNQTGCLGPACFEVCSEVIAVYGGFMGKAADLAMKFGACAQTYCMQSCLEDWGPGADGGDEGGEN